MVACTWRLTFPSRRGPAVLGPPARQRRSRAGRFASRNARSTQSCIWLPPGRAVDVGYDAVAAPPQRRVPRVRLRPSAAPRLVADFHASTLLRYFTHWRYLNAMRIGYARVSSDSQDTAAQVAVPAVRASIAKWLQGGNETRLSRVLRSGKSTRFPVRFATCRPLYKDWPEPKLDSAV